MCINQPLCSNSAIWNIALLQWMPDTAESLRPFSRRSSICWISWTDRVTWSICWRENWPAPPVTAHCSSDSWPHSQKQSSSYWLWSLTVTVSTQNSWTESVHFVVNLSRAAVYCVGNHHVYRSSECKEGKTEIPKIIFQFAFSSDDH